MSDDFDLDETSSEGTEPEPAPSPEDASNADYWRKRAERAEKQAIERKVALRRFETAAKHGAAADAIPEWVPLDKMDEFAAKYLQPAESVAADRTEQQVETPEPEVAPQASEAERQLAAVAKGPGGAVSPTGIYSPEEALQLAKADPERAAKLLADGLLNLEQLPGSTRR